VSALVVTATACTMPSAVMTLTNLSIAIHSSSFRISKRLNPPQLLVAGISKRT
jgi:hypothetical protein